MRICYLWNTPKSKQVTIGASERGAFIFAKKAMENYKKVFIQIEDINFGTIPNGEISYTRNLFIRDFLDKPDFQWEKYLAKLLDKTNNAFKAVESRLDNFNYQELTEHLEHDLDYSGNEYSFTNHRGKIVLFNISSSEYQVFSTLMNCRENLNRIKEDLSTCIEYYKEEVENPPFKEYNTTTNKIPFLGSTAEFSALFALLHKVGYLGTKEPNKFTKKEYEFLSPTRFKELSKLIKTKTMACNLLADHFFTLQIDKENSNIIKEFLNPNTIESKFNDDAINRLGDVPRTKLLEKLTKAIKILDSDKNPKNQKDN